MPNETEGGIKDDFEFDVEFDSDPAMEIAEKLAESTPELGGLGIQAVAKVLYECQIDIDWFKRYIINHGPRRKCKSNSSMW